MRIKGCERVVFAGAALFTAVLFSFTHISTAQSSGWLSGQPTVSEGRTISAPRIPDYNVPCSVMKITLVYSSSGRKIEEKRNECMVSTTFGFMNRNGDILQLNISSKAYFIDKFGLGEGFRNIMPIDGSNRVLLYKSDPNLAGLNYGSYEDFMSRTTFNAASLKYVVQGNPDFMFKFSNNRFMAMSSLSFSEDKRYLLTNVIGHAILRVDIESKLMKPVAPSPASQTTKIAIDNSELYAAVGLNGPYAGAPPQSLKIFDSSTCDTNETTSITEKPVFTCQGADYYGLLASKAPAIRLLSGLEFEGSDRLLVDISRTGLSMQQYVMSAANAEPSIPYLGLGDSFASGEGAYSYREGTDTKTNKCHQSLKSYPYLLSNTSKSVSIACSGADLRHVLGGDEKLDNDQLKGKEPTDDDIAKAIVDRIPGVTLQRVVAREHNPQSITISIGGNDVGFDNIVKKCVAPFNNVTSFGQNCYETYEDRKELVGDINKQFKNLVSTYKEFKGAGERRVYVIGYPQVVSATGECAINVRMSQKDREFAGLLIDYLNSVIERAAKKAGVVYVDNTKTFDGHKLCEDNKKLAMNGLTFGDDTFIIGNESYHPNAYGHQLFASAIASQTQDLTKPMPEPDDSLAAPEIVDSLPILQAPKTNRIVYETINLFQDINYVQSLNPINFTVNNLKTIIKPGGIYRAVFRSQPIELGNVTANNDGTLFVNLTTPAGVTPGFHTVHLYGENMAGDPIDIQQIVYVQASTTDTDGDGVENVVDSCKTIPNSNVDADKDGVDDACDPEQNAITAPVESTKPTSEPDQTDPVTDETNNTTNPQKTASVAALNTIAAGSITRVIGGSPVSAAVQLSSLARQDAAVLGATTSDGPNDTPEPQRRTAIAPSIDDTTKESDFANSKRSIGLIAIIGVLIVIWLLVRHSRKPARRF